MYISGLMLYGMGSYFFMNERVLLEFASHETNRLFSMVGIFAVGIGVSLIIYLFYQFYKRVAQKQKLKRALKAYLLVVLIGGLTFGLLGEGIYRWTQQSYDWVKQFIWVLTTYIQEITRVIFLYYCLMLYQENPLDWKSTVFRKMLGGVFLLLSFTIWIQLFFPVIGSVILCMTDLILAIGVVYLELFQSTKKRS